VPIHAALWALLCAFVNKSEVLSHVTQRVVDGIRARPDTAVGVPVVVVIDHLPPVPNAEIIGIDPADWLRVPPPSRFMVYADDMYSICLIGVFLDAVGAAPAVISWMPLDWDTPVEIELPGNALGAFFATLDYAADSLSVRRVDWFGAVDGYEILSLRNEFDAYR
jgi:hypothetical protein